MDRIKKIFARCRRENRAALIAYHTCGCPDLTASEAAIDALIGGGAEIIELGVPFSDPMADGPVIQAASQLALEKGVKFADILALAARLRSRHPETGLILFTYYNLIFRYGPERLAATAAAAGLDGILCVDLPFEERGELKPACDRYGLHLIALLSPATPPARAREIVAAATGFVYYVTVCGVTGERGELPAASMARLAALRQHSPVPVAAGFGIGTPETARQAAQAADGVIVGSALVRLQLAGTPPEAIAAEVRKLADALKSSLPKP